MDWSGVDYWDTFISCLDSHSDGTHSQHYRKQVMDAEFLQICSDEGTHLDPGWPEV